MFSLYAECVVDGKNRGYVSFDNECFKLTLDNTDGFVKGTLIAKKILYFPK